MEKYLTKSYSKLKKEREEKQKVEDYKKSILPAIVFLTAFIAGDWLIHIIFN